MTIELMTMLPEVWLGAVDVVSCCFGNPGAQRYSGKEVECCI